MIAVKIALAGICIAIVAADAHAQSAPPSTSGVAAETANRIVDKNGLGLSPAQSQLIVQVTANEKLQASTIALSIGTLVPESMMLVELPIEVKDQIGSLRDFKFARLQNDTIVLVDPTSRVVVDVIQN